MLAAGLAGQAHAAADGVPVERQMAVVRAADAELAAVAHRLATANAPLCRDLQPGAGLAIQALDQFGPTSRTAARRVFGFGTPVAVEAVVPGGPAERAGVRPGDGLLAVNGAALPTVPAAQTSSATRDRALELLAAPPPAAPLRLDLMRDGVRRTVTLQPRPACRAAFELNITQGLAASSDGRVVQLGGALFDRFGPDGIAVVAAHELAHVVLRHRARLEAAGVRWGLLAEWGRNARLFRRTEGEADLLGLHLLRNAGYDPRIAVAFWRGPGAAVGGGLFRARTHDAPAARADALAAELARLPANAPVPYLPPILAERDRPLR